MGNLCALQVEKSCSALTLLNFSSPRVFEKLLPGNKGSDMSWSRRFCVETEMSKQQKFNFVANLACSRMFLSRNREECRPKLQSKVAISKVATRETKVAIRIIQSCNKNLPKLQQEPNQSYNKNQSCNQNMKFIKITKFNWNFHQKSTISYSLVTLISNHQV